MAEEKVKAFSPAWWEARNALMQDLAKDQASLRKNLVLPGDKDPELRRLEQRVSDAAMAVALYGAGELPDGRELERAWDLAASELAAYKNRGR